MTFTRHYLICNREKFGEVIILVVRVIPMKAEGPLIVTHCVS